MRSVVYIWVVFFLKGLGIQYYPLRHFLAASGNCVASWFPQFVHFSFSFVRQIHRLYRIDDMIIELSSDNSFNSDCEPFGGASIRVSD